jgi:hypothetical protein
VQFLHRVGAVGAADAATRERGQAVQKGGGVKQLTACRTAATQSPPAAASRLLGFRDERTGAGRQGGRHTGEMPVIRPKRIYNF